MSESHSVPEHHPLRRMFRTLTDRALSQSSVSDRDLLIYLSDLLVEFVYVENLYRLKDETGARLEYLIDMLAAAGEAPHGRRKAFYRHLGDYTLFVLGMFPESLTRGRRALSHSDYADTGRRSYMAASRLEQDREATLVLRKLAGKFERCVLSLHWIREYTSDPFYQYMFRQFRITP